MATQKGVWNLQQVRDKQLQSLWDYSTTLTNLYAWGDNTFGELYLAGVTGGEPAKRSSPVQIPCTNWVINVSQFGYSLAFSIGRNFAAAIKNDGTLWRTGGIVSSAVYAAIAFNEQLSSFTKVLEDYALN